VVQNQETAGGFDREFRMMRGGGYVLLHFVEPIIKLCASRRGEEVHKRV
jgi:hypothetical protein